MIIIDHFSVRFGRSHYREADRINETLRLYKLDADAIVSILPMWVDGKQEGFIVYYRKQATKKELAAIDEMGTLYEYTTDEW